jgi:hypothetical protein
VAGWALAASAQGADCGASGERILVSSPEQAQPAAGALGEVVREIDDPGTGDRWLLERDPEHPGGPGRLVLTGSGESRPRTGERWNAGPETAPGADRTVPLPVIHAGDHLIVEENTAVVEARLEAVALGTAVSGADLNVRLEIGGKVVRAVALGPGRAAFAPESETEP